MDLKEKASYIKGLFEGSKLNLDDDKNKIFGLSVDLLQEIAEKVQKLDKISYENTVLIDEIDEDLANIERDFHKIRTNLDTKQTNHMKNCDCNANDSQDQQSLQEEEDEYIEENKYEVSCPSCNRVVELNDEIFEKDDIFCPECGERLNFSFKDDEEV